MSACGMRRYATARGVLAAGASEGWRGYVHTDDPNLDPNKYLNGNYQMMIPAQQSKTGVMEIVDSTCSVRLLGSGSQETDTCILAAAARVFRIGMLMVNAKRNTDTHDRSPAGDAGELHALMFAI